MHALSPPSPWVVRWSHLVAAGAPVLDLACGRGRHARHFADRGHPVTGVDRDAQALDGLHQVAEVVCADIESGPWPLAGRRFGAVVITNYLWRPLWPRILDSLAPGGVLLVETFALGNATVGRPANPDFLLRPGELLDVARPALRVVAYEDGFLEEPTRFVQRMAAVREDAAAAAGEHPPRHRLSPP